MAVFSQNYTLALIKEVGEDDVLVEVNGQDIEIPLSEKNRQTVFDMVEEDIYLVEFDLERNEILTIVDDETLYELYPEIGLEELADSTEEIDE